MTDPYLAIITLAAVLFAGRTLAHTWPLVYAAARRRQIARQLADLDR